MANDEEKDGRMLRVLYISDFAPDYREGFFRCLGALVDLTVVAPPCESASLSPPMSRGGYTYLEVPVFAVGPFCWQPQITSLVRQDRWDVVCVGLNLRHLARVWAFIVSPKVRHKWVWRGHILGSHDQRMVHGIKRWLLRRSQVCLVYSEPDEQEVRRRYGVEAVSFNNSQVSLGEFIAPEGRVCQGLNLLYVGRNQPRKKLHRLIDLAERRGDVSVRLIGPGMEALHVPRSLEESGRVQRFGRTVGRELEQHFEWAELVVNPGHAGLLIVNAARHGRPIAIDSESRHAPEYWLAKLAEQPFINFSSNDEVDALLDRIAVDKWYVNELGQKLQRIARQQFTVEHMAEVHYREFVKVAAKVNQGGVSATAHFGGRQ